MNAITIITPLARTLVDYCLTTIYYSPIVVDKKLFHKRNYTIIVKKINVLIFQVNLLSQTNIMSLHEVWEYVSKAGK